MHHKKQNLHIHASNTRFSFQKQTFINNARLKLAKKQAKAKQHPEAEPLLFGKYTPFSIHVTSKTNMRYSKKCTKKSASV